MCKLSSRCASFVGCRGGVQPIYLSDSCSVGNLCHEIVHALGLHHEHTRVDRDRYITVQWQNILPGRVSTINASSQHDGNLHWRVCNIYWLIFFFFLCWRQQKELQGEEGQHSEPSIWPQLHHALWTVSPDALLPSATSGLLSIEEKINKCCFVAGTFLVMMDVRRCWPSRGGRRWVRGHTSPSWISRNWTDSTTVVPHLLCFSTQWFLLQFLYLWMWRLQT